MGVWFGNLNGYFSRKSSRFEITEQLLMILTILVRACDQDQDQRADFPIRWVTGYAAKASTTSRPIAVFVILRLTTNADLMFSLYT